MATFRRRTGSQITLARAISKFGIASRAVAAGMIKSGRVRVNARVTKFPGLWVDLKDDTISLDGRRLRGEKQEYLALNKPAGVVTTRSDERGRKTVYAYLPDHAQWLFPVGRLDKETSGLLLFTNDTRFGHRISDPVEGVPKTYRVEINRPLLPQDREKMEKGMALAGGAALKPAGVVMAPGNPHVFSLTVSEGRNRQVRRMCETLGYRVVSLRRTSIGSIELGDLREGETRSLTAGERALLMSEQANPKIHGHHRLSHR